MVRTADSVGRPQEHAHESRLLGVTALLLYAICAAVILTKQPILNVLCIFPLVAFGVAGYPVRPGQNVILGAPVTSIPVFGVILWNLYLTAVWSTQVVQFIYVATYAGLDNAVHGRVQLIQRRIENSSRLSSGQVLPAHVWLSSDVIIFLLLIVGFLGLCGMVDWGVRVLREGSRHE